MSKASKGIQMNKIISLFEKADLDEQVKGFKELKEYLNKKLIERAEEHETKATSLRDVAETINI